MDENEDSAAAEKREPLVVQLRRKLSEMPDPLPLGAAVAMFVDDLETSKDAFTRHDQMGCSAAMLAAMRMCHALGRPELSKPFSTILTGLKDLQQGVTPPLFRKAKETEDSPKSSVEWYFSATIAVYLDVLSKDFELKMPDAAKLIAGILDKTKTPFGNASKQTWRSVMSVREEIRRRPQDDETKNYYFYELNGLRQTLGSIHPDVRKAAVLGALEKTIRAEGKIPGQPPSNP